MKTILIAAVLFLAIGAYGQSQQKAEQIMSGGIKRTFVTYIPLLNDVAYRPPLLISLHGRLGTGERTMAFSDFRPMADKDKFIIVCPDGINRSWNDGRVTPAEKKGIDDVEFIRELIAYMVNVYHVDSSRVYVTGMSNGGFMASRLACARDVPIAAIAVVAASMDKGMDYTPVHALPVMYIQGTADPLVPYDGGMMKKGAGGEIYSHSEILQQWAVADSCNNKPIVTHLPDNTGDGTTITREEYSNANGLKVIGYSIINGGHTWPGGTQYLPKFLVGGVSHNLNACQAIWDFVKNYRHTYSGVNK
jgi:polyhydroxybutyrate depolymerase